MNLSEIFVPFILTSMALFLSSCQPQNLCNPQRKPFFHGENTAIKTGGVKMIPVKTPNGTFKIRTKCIGNNSKIKILMPAGSPGLPQLTIPTLTIVAKYDEMNPAHMKWMAGQVKNGSYLYCTIGSHLSLYDDQKTYMNGVIKYTKTLNKGALHIPLTQEE